MPIVNRAGQPDIYYALDDFTDPWRNASYLILQHGFGRSGRFRYSWVPYLARWFKVVRPDVRGLGQSSDDFDLENEFTVEKAIEAPVLGLYPSAGPITSAEQEAMLKKNIRNLRMIHLPSNFHKIQLMFPSTCAMHLLHFAAAHDGFACHEA